MNPGCDISKSLTQVATFHMNGFFHFYDEILNLLFQHLDSIFNRILVCLAVTDNIFVLTCLLGSVQRYFFTASPFLDLLFLHVVYPVSTNQAKLVSNDTRQIRISTIL